MACLMLAPELTRDLNGNNVVVNVQPDVSADFLPEIWADEVLASYKNNLVMGKIMGHDMYASDVVPEGQAFVFGDSVVMNRKSAAQIKFNA